MAAIPLIGAGIGAGATAIGSGKQAAATDRATAATSEANRNALAFNQQVFDTTQANQQPFLDLGGQATGQLSAGLRDGALTAGYPGGPFSFSGVDLQNDPAYRFNLDQQNEAIQRSAAARGGLLSGGTQQDLARATSGYASNQFQQSYTNALAAYQQAYSQFENQQGNTFNRLASLAGLGESAAAGTANAGLGASQINAGTTANTANTLANLTTAQGNAAGAATIAGGNAIAGALNQYQNDQNWKNTLAQSTASSYGRR